MQSVVIGVRHKRAPIEIRERVAFCAEELQDALREMVTYPGIVEGAILSTCNRTEVYATVTDTEQGISSLKAFLKEYKKFDYNQNMAYAFCLLYEDAVMHLFRVASGLDSLILGEGQIMAQVKETLKTAMAARTSGEIIERMFKSALSVGKAVRTETGIANRDVSVARAAFEFVSSNYPDFLEKRCALIGAGKMAEILLSSLRQVLPESKRNNVVLVNRTQKHGEALSQKYGFPCLGWDSLNEVISEYDTLFIATGSPHHLLPKSLFETAKTPKVIIDIAVPRNVDPEVAKLPGIDLYNTDHLSGYSGYNGENRIRILKQAHNIIEQEYEKYHQWFVGRSAAPMITQLRAQVEDIRKAEVAELQAYCPHVQKSCSVIDDLSRTLVNKILHIPTVQLKSIPQLDEIYRQAEFLSRLFHVPKAPACNDTPAETAAASEESAKVIAMPLRKVQ